MLAKAIFVSRFLLWIESAAVFIRNDKRPHHFGIDKVPIQVQLAEPMVKARPIGIPPQVAEVFNKHKCRIELLVVEGFTVSGVEN